MKTKVIRVSEMYVEHVRTVLRYGIRMCCRWCPTYVYYVNADKRALSSLKKSCILRFLHFVCNLLHIVPYQGSEISGRVPRLCGGDVVRYVHVIIRMQRRRFDNIKVARKSVRSMHVKSIEYPGVYQSKACGPPHPQTLISAHQSLDLGKSAWLTTFCRELSRPSWKKCT